MGSLLTQQPEQMGWLMDELHERDTLFFVDSYTTPASVGLTMAHEHGVPALRRAREASDTATRGFSA